MSADIWIWIAWAVFLVVAWPFAQYAKHPAAKPLAAYLIFVTVFAVVGWGLFLLGTIGLVVVGGPGAVGGILPMLLFGAFCTVVAAIAGRLVIRQPPRHQPLPP